MCTRNFVPTFVRQTRAVPTFIWAEVGLRGLKRGVVAKKKWANGHF